MWVWRRWIFSGLVAFDERSIENTIIAYRLAKLAQTVTYEAFGQMRKQRYRESIIGLMIEFLEFKSVGHKELRTFRRVYGRIKFLFDTEFDQ